MDTKLDNPSPIQQLRHIMRQLRHPENGCAWDIKQNFSSIASFTLEEAYEVVDAIEREDTDDLKDELGDLLFQVIFHSQMASELGLFDFDDVTTGIVKKMIRRHPHVFGDVVYETEAELKLAWEAIKAQERQQKLARKTQQRVNTAKQDGAKADSTLSCSEIPSNVSIVDGIAKNLTALKQAEKLQKRAAGIGFDWPDVEPVWAKLSEEITEVKQACLEDDQSAVIDEIGDLLFTAVNLARHLRVDPEAALRQSSRKFETRFRKVEALAASDNTTLAEVDLAGLDALWDTAKKMP